MQHYISYQIQTALGDHHMQRGSAANVLRPICKVNEWRKPKFDPRKI